MPSYRIMSYSAHMFSMRCTSTVVRSQDVILVQIKFTKLYTKCIINGERLAMYSEKDKYQGKHI